MAQSMVEHVVADAGAFLKKAPLQEMGRNIYTLREVVDEIRDRATRRSLAFLPYKLTFREPMPEHIRTVTEFSKKTGDYPSLSATDIKVLALTYQLEVEHVGSQHLKTEPEVKINVHSTQRHPETPVNVAGFHFPSKKNTGSSGQQTPRSESQIETVVDDEEFNSFRFWREPLPAIEDELLGLLNSLEVQKSDDKPNQTSSPSYVVSSNEEFNSFQFWRTPLPMLDGQLMDLLEVGDTSKEWGEPKEDQSDDENKENEPEEEEAEDEEDEDDDGGGWITPSNIQKVKMDSSDWTVPANIQVGCLTTDFAMQNVLLQIGLQVLSVDGMLIKQARNYILRCHACFKTTSNMTKKFCPHCGNQTLKKVAVTLNLDGSIVMHFSRNPRVLNPRGLRHPLPLPHGGKHSNNPCLVEDQRFPQQRLSRKARQQTDVFNPDYVAGASPFSSHDIYSRSASLHLRDAQYGGGRRRANPNAARGKFIKKK